MAEVNVGMKFGRLTVESQVGNYKRWNCVCECGGHNSDVPQSHLLSGNTKSCGCLSRDIVIERNTSHGMSKRPEYSHWKGIMKRCFNPNDKRAASYFDKGITVHEDFIKNFPAWLKEIGEKPTSEGRWSVGRIDNNGDYTYGNMRWELDDQQARNHNKQVNNTSGIVGVAIRTTTIAGVDYPAWVACWNTLEGKKTTKNFSINKYGNEDARELAIRHRNKMIEQLNEQGAEYAESHGSEKQGGV